MLIRQLEYLVTLSKVKHFAKAAEICHVTQPTLSAAIRNLEEQLNISIIKRSYRYEGLTSEGELILQYIHKIMNAWKEMKRVADTIKNSNNIRIGSIPTAIHLVSLLQNAYLSNDINVHENVRIMNMKKIQETLLSHEIDLGIGYINSDLSPEIKFLPILKEKFMLLSKKPSSIEQTDQSLSWKEASKLPLALLSKDMENRHHIDNMFKRSNVIPNIVLETNSLITIYNHVISNGYYSIIPKTWSMLTLIPSLKDLVLIDLDPSFEIDVGFIVLNKEPHSHLIDVILKYAQSLKDKFSFP